LKHILHRSPVENWRLSLRFSASTHFLKVKVKLSVFLTKHHAMKTYWGSEGIASRILDLSIRWRWAISFTLRPLYPQWKSLLYPLVTRLGGPQSRSGRDAEKNSQPPPGIEHLNPDRPVRSQSRYRLSYPGSSSPMSPLLFRNPNITWRQLSIIRKVIRSDDSILYTPVLVYSSPPPGDKLRFDGKHGYR
jgi:hypothetical protein